MKTDFKVVIPARYASSRLPGKPLLNLAGRPMIEHVYRCAQESGAQQVVVATDDLRIQEACLKFGAEVCMTAENHPSGTDRIAEVVSLMCWPDSSIVINLQGDEPLMPPGLIVQLAEDMAKHQDAGIATLCTPIHTAADLLDPHIVKVVMDEQGYALYFSRAAIPWDRNAFEITTAELPRNSRHYRHIGLYAYHAGFIRRYSQLAPCYIEITESLEQLRALWHGVKIHVSITETPPGHGVDTEKDLERVAGLIEKR